MKTLYTGTKTEGHIREEDDKDGGTIAATDCAVLDGDPLLDPGA